MLTPCLLAAIWLPQEPIADERRPLPTLGRTVRDQRWLDPITGRILRRTTDAATGAAVDGDALLRAESAAADAAHGRIGADLRAELRRRRAEERLTVVFWLERPAGLPDLRSALEAARAAGLDAAEARRRTLTLAATATEPATAAFADRLRAAGHEVVQQDAYAPIVFARLRAADVAAVAQWQGVDQVYYSFPTWLPEEGPGPEGGIAEAGAAAPPNEWASPSARTDTVHRRGITGAGVKVLVNDVGAVARNNPSLPPIVVGNATATVQAHATAVAGMIASHHAQQHGAAPGLTELYDYAGASDTAAPLAWAWGMQQGISFGNCSWWNFNLGSIVFLDRYFDYIIRNFAVQLFKSCGNQGNNVGCTTPGNGFNMVACGNANDADTHDWDDDTLSTSSSTGNPQPSNHEKPEVCAHGTNITSTNTSGGVSAQGSGTSYAAPVACGTAALLAQADPVLQAAPEAIKALLMAGAWNDITGGQPLSDFDGAGAIDAAASWSAVASGQYVRSTLSAASFPGGVATYPIHLDGGDETRIVALWSSLADSAYSTTVLEMDLDLVVRAPGGAVVAASASTANPFEIVQFVPQVTGTYTVELQPMRFQGTAEPFALAWTTSWDTRVGRVTVTGAPRVGATVGIEFFDRYHPGQIYFGLLSATAYPATWRVPQDKVVRLGYDPFLDASLSLPGFVGPLPANGRATTSLTIPGLAGLAGLTFELGMLTLQQGLPVVEEIGDVTTVTILP
jgi:hypothetical protein